MENLKQNINKTDTLKNDLKLAKNKINDKILSGGGTIADTISDVPSAIDKMLKENYKKVAIIDPTEYLPFPSNNSESIDYTVNTNFAFKPSKIFLNFILRSVSTGKYLYYGGIDVLMPDRAGTAMELEVVNISIIEVKETYVKVRVRPTFNNFHNSIKIGVIAIE